MKLGDILLGVLIGWLTVFAFAAFLIYIEGSDADCKLVVGSGDAGGTKVYLCRYDTHCLYVNNKGGMLETPCLQHPMAEEVSP